MYPGTHAELTPDKAAVIVPSTGEQTTFAELEAASIQVARYLGTLGLVPGDHLAVLATNCAKVFDIYWGAMRSGLYLTMLNSHLTPAEIAFIVGDCGASAVLIDARLGAEVGDLIDKFDRVPHLASFSGTIDGIPSADAGAAAQSSLPLADQPCGADMLYSSGTTGRPKGVKPALPDRQVTEPGDAVVHMNSAIWGIGSDDVYLSPAPLYHAAPLRTCAAVQALGGTVVVMDRFDPVEALRLIEEYAVTYSQWVPTMFVRMLKLPEEDRHRYDVSSQRVVVHAAAPCPVEAKKQMIDWWGPIIDEYYSSTEMIGVTVARCGEWLERPGTVGRAILGSVRICGEDGQVLAPGEIGTVYFEGATTQFEYHNDSAKTQDARHPSHPNWSTTGDVGYLDEAGYLFLTDRRAFTIISGGVNIYPQEIENLLVEHPAVLDAAVIGVPDAEMGESVLAVVSPLGQPDEDGLERELLEYLSARIARFKLPRRFEFSADLPRTPTGKLVKSKLRESFADITTR